MPQTPLRWLAISIFILSTSLNYLDRQLLAALAPTLRTEFHLNNEQYGQIQSAFFAVYAIVAPFAGWLVDRVGLNLGAGLAVTVWSLAGAATAMFTSFGGLLGCRTVLGAAEAASIPSTGKANAIYLESHELALGTALNQVGITIGMTAAPLLVASLAPRYGWRSTFALCGALGLLWVPLWWFTSRRVPAASQPEVNKADSAPFREIVFDRRLWGLAAANALIMTVYALWTNWTTLYFVHERHMTQDQANLQFVWIPTVFAIAGGFTGGGLAYWWISRGLKAVSARMRVCWIGAAILLATAATPLMPTPALATAVISLSFFWTLTISTNVYALPIDLFGPKHAAFGIAALTCAYGTMTALLSPAIGALVDRAGFTPVCVAISVLPLAGVMVLHYSAREKPA